MDESTGVNPGASSGGEFSSGSVSGDTAATSEATSTGAEQSAPVPEQTATQGESVATGDAAGAEYQLPISEEEIAQAPDQWREKLTSLLSGYKSLESDHRTLKGEREKWQSLQEHGDPQAITARLAELNGLGAVATDQNGQIVRDNNGFPVMTTSPFLQDLAKRENGPALADQLAADIWYMQRPGMNGQTYGDALLEMIGLDPKMIEHYKAGAQSQVSTGEVSPDEIKVLGEVFPNNQAYSKAYESLTLSERQAVQTLLNDFRDQEAEAILKREAGRLQQAEKLQQLETYQQQQAENELKTFWNGVSETYNKHIDQSNRDAIAALTKQIGSQVTFSADPTTNTIQTNAIGGMVAAICHQPTRFAMEPVLQALGVTFDPAIDGMLAQYEQHMQTYISLKSAAENPRYAQYRNDTEMNRAKQAADSIQQRVLAKLAPIGAKLAKVMAGQNQELRDQRGSGLTAATQGRPTFNGNGGSTVNGKQIPKGMDPFSVEFLQHISG